MCGWNQTRDITVTPSKSQRGAAFHLLLTGSGAHSVHGRHGLPLVPLGVVALAGAEPVGPVEASDGVKQAVDDGDAHADTPRQHGGYEMPLVPFWIIPAEEERRGERASSDGHERVQAPTEESRAHQQVQNT